MLVVYKELPSRKFGVELEVSPVYRKPVIGDLLKRYESSTKQNHDVIVTSGTKGWAETIANNYWHVKYDSTCGPKGKGKDHGWEIASFIGHNDDDLIHIARAADFLHESGLTTNLNCGLHIHVEAKDLDPYEMGVLLARWIKVEPLLMCICHPCRTNNKYCKSLLKRWLDRKWICSYSPAWPQQFWQDMAPTCLNTHSNDDKKFTLNTVGWTIGQVISYYSRQTIELRLPECDLNSSHILNWGRLFVNFVEGCRNCSAPLDLEIADNIYDAMRYLNLQGSTEFFLLDQRLLDTKLWFLRKILNSQQAKAKESREANELIEFISTI